MQTWWGFCPGKVEGEIKYRMYLVVAVNSDMVGVLPRES
jgi:hypothetical protein